MRHSLGVHLAAALLLLQVGAACRHGRPNDVETRDAQPLPTLSALSAPPGLPASAATVRVRLATSPRHGEWAMIRTGPEDSVRAWIVYPERSTKAPVVVVIHEIFGLSTWVRGVADALAAAGYIAIAPDLLTGKGQLEGDTLPNSVATTAIRTLRPDDVHRQLAAAAHYGMGLPAALPRYGVVGFCWGGARSFEHAVRAASGLGAAVVYYGASPDTSDLARVGVPVLGLYAGDDERINARLPATDSTMRRFGKPYEMHIFDGAGHGYLRNQEGRAANLTASQRSWPLTVAFFRRQLGA